MRLSWPNPSQYPPLSLFHLKVCAGHPYIEFFMVKYCRLLFGGSASEHVGGLFGLGSGFAGWVIFFFTGGFAGRIGFGLGVSFGFAGIDLGFVGVFFVRRRRWFVFVRGGYTGGNTCTVFVCWVGYLL